MHTQQAQRPGDRTGQFTHDRRVSQGRGPCWRGRQGGKKAWRLRPVHGRPWKTEMKSWDIGFCFWSFFVLFFNWWIIVLQYCVGFCHTSAWISHSFLNKISEVLLHLIGSVCFKQFYLPIFFQKKSLFGCTWTYLWHEGSFVVACGV